MTIADDAFYCDRDEHGSERGNTHRDEHGIDVATVSHDGSRAARLGGYVLPGGPTDITPVVAQATALEAAGVGAVYLGERYATKDLPAIAGALSQVTTSVRLIGAVTHIGTRHPMVLASMGQTLQALSGERFVLGFGRGSAGRWDAYGVAAPTARSLADITDILRRLWAGERVTYDGPAGRYPDLQLMEIAPVTAPPLLLAGVGPNTLDLAGRAFEGAILHPLLTTDAVADSVARVRAAADRAGRDPEQVEVHATVIVAPDRPAHEIVGARGLGYLLVTGLGESIVGVNGWDPARLDEIRAHKRFAGLAYHQLKSLPVDVLTEVSQRLPEAWLAGGAASGSADECAARIDEYLDAGATHVLLHGLDAEATARFMAAYRRRVGQG